MFSGGFPKIRGTILRYRILGSILGSLYFGKLPYNPYMSHNLNSEYPRQ